jgi:hypothetical protein
METGSNGFYENYEMIVGKIREENYCRKRIILGTPVYIKRLG